MVTKLIGSNATHLYEQLYYARGEAENCIKEVQLDLFGTRASCHRSSRPTRSGCRWLS